jgi:hypothetical protein
MIAPLRSGLPKLLDRGAQSLPDFFEDLVSNNFLDAFAPG